MNLVVNEKNISLFYLNNLFSNCLYQNMVQLVFENPRENDQIKLAKDVGVKLTKLFSSFTYNLIRLNGA